MPVICRFFGVVIAMYWDDHAPPHFHAKYGGQEADIEIESGLVGGHLPPRILGVVQEWRVLHRDELLENWTLCQRHEALKTLLPLE